MPRRSSVRRPAHDLPSGPITTSHATVELTTDKADPNGVMLLIDGAESSYLDLSDPTHLVFEYMQQMMAVLEETMTPGRVRARSEEHTSELQSRGHLVCRLLLEKKKLRKSRARGRG